MIANIFNSTTIPYLQESASFAESRHQVLAGNLANIETPDYRTRDLSPEVFQERLKELMEFNAQPPSSSPSLGLTAASPPGVLGESEGADEALRKVHDAQRTLLFHDKSDVGLEEQVLAVTKNQFQHNVALAIMNSQFRLIATAISERL